VSSTLNGQKKNQISMELLKGHVRRIDGRRSLASERRLSTEFHAVVFAFTLLEIPLESPPDGVVVVLQLLRLQRELRRAEDVARLPHEGERVVDLLRLELGGACAL